jgi:hypothetical protein
MVAPTQYIIAIKDPNNPPVKVLRLSIARDGSYSVFSPYHPATSGLLFRRMFPEFLAGGRGWLELPRTVYSVDVPVKLSLHSSGFVQFSSAGQKPIFSGHGRIPLMCARHAPPALPSADLCSDCVELLVSRGLGVNSQSLLTPIETGPTWLAPFFQLHECPPLGVQEKYPVLLFEDQDFFDRDEHDAISRHQYAVEGFVFPASLRKYATLGRHGWILEREYSPWRPEWDAVFRVIDLPTPVAFLGILVSRQHADPDGEGGYSLSSPRDIASGFHLAGVFPRRDRDAGVDADAGRVEVPLEYVPEMAPPPGLAGTDE